MSIVSDEELQKLIAAAQARLNDPDYYAKLQADLDVLFPGLKEMKQSIETENQKWAEENPKQAACDHGLTFDEEAAQLISQETPGYDTGDPAVDFIMGSPASDEIRRRWPRLCGECPKGCGYNGIAYVSHAHMLYGDW
jgi:hypothetical protein